MNQTSYRSSFLIIIVLFFLFHLIFMLSANLLVEEAYYWNYANHLDFSFLDHPPMVALLIKLGISLWGTNEWGVRFATIPCWLLTGYFSFKLTNLIRKGAGIYTIALLSVLPFFFIHSHIITPDIPLILSWSASLYYLYQALILDQSKKWYLAGLWLGLGLLSKYTIVLLGLATVTYLILEPSSRKWFFRKEPYLCALISVLLFFPVIYWNATHHWASFQFQSTRRLQEHYTFSLPLLIGVLVIFLTPAGVFGGWLLYAKERAKNLVATKTQRFLQIYTAIPLLFFSLFSLFHTIKVNWIGPSLLAIIPWFATLIAQDQKIIGLSTRKSWITTCGVLLFCYSGMMYCIFSGKPQTLNHYLFPKLIHWDDFTNQLHRLADTVEIKNHEAPIIVPLDIYNIGSEFIFYQQKLLDHHQINSTYKVIGSHVFGLNSLMYQYWGSVDETKGKLLLLVSKELYLFKYINNTVASSPVLELTDYNQHNKNSAVKFYYQLVKMS